MNFHFRINVNSQIGIGHLMRTSRIAKKLKIKGHQCFFYLDKQSSRFVNNLQEYKVCYLYGKGEAFKNQLNDSQLFIQKIKSKNGYVIVDDYRLGELWERKISSKDYKIIVIDDLQNKKHFSDIYINAKPDFHRDSNFKFINILKKDCKILIGPEYNIIDCNNQKIIKKNKIINLVFYNGGGGNLSKIYNIIKYLLDYDPEIYKKVKLTIVLGPMSVKKDIIYDLAKKNKKIEIINDRYNINSVIANADLIVGSAGNLVYESAFYKIPTLLFQISDNQVTDLESMEKLGHYFILKKKDLERYEKVSNLIISMIENYNRVKKLSKTSEIKIDNKGIDRIIKSINNKKNIYKLSKKEIYRNIKSKNLIIRKVNDKDLNHYLFARNLKENRQVSLFNKIIPSTDHYIWWLNSNRKSYLLSRGNEKILYFYDEIITFNKKKYSKQGWFICSRNCSIQDILYALNWQKKMIAKIGKITASLSVVTKKNKINLSKYLGWTIIEENTPLEYIARQIYGTNKNNRLYSR